MMFDSQASDFFTAGGTLPPDAPSYVKRPTDDELFHHLMAGEFCYVLTPRQMGKSSLMIRTARRLMEAGAKSAIVDLTQIGTVDNEDQWYKGILSQIKRRLRLTMDPLAWWESRGDIPNILKFVGFFEELLTEMPERVVVFMDEIDTTLKLEFRDDFFAGIRALFNARAENPDLKRITFVLLGVASPSDLIKDRNRTPFNIGQEIPLRPFSRDDARMLEPGLDEIYPERGRIILDRVFHWTNGHPYLTQKLCQSLVETRQAEPGNEQIDELVRKLFTSEEASRETNLQFVRDNVLSYPERRVILQLYRKILRGAVVPDDKNSLPQNHLKLSGLARVENDRLTVGNRIYSQVFDQRWVNRHTETDWRYPIIIFLAALVLGFASIFYNDGPRLDNLASTLENDIPIYIDKKSIQYLADLFNTKPILLQGDYAYRAKSAFFTINNWNDQHSLLEITPAEAQDNIISPEDYETIVKGLYTSLADVDSSGDTTEFLNVMLASMKTLGLENSPTYLEIEYWLQARTAIQNSKFDNSMFNDAVYKYGLALKLNPDNPATAFELARVYAQQGKFDLALTSYEQVIANAQKANTDPAEGQEGATPGNETPALQPTLASTLMPTLNTPTETIEPATNTSEPSLQPSLTITSVTSYGTGFVKKGLVSVWKEPNKNKLATLGLNQTVVILEIKVVAGADWYRCTWNDNETPAEGWVLAEYITVTGISTSTPAPSLTPNLPTPTRRVTPTLELPTSTATSSPTPSAGIRPRFISQSEVITAVRDDITRNPALSAAFFARTNPTEFPNLGVYLPTPTPFPTPTAEVRATATPTITKPGETQSLDPIPTPTETATETPSVPVTPSPGTYTIIANSALAEFKASNCWANNVQDSDGLSQRADRNIQFRVSDGKPADELVETDFSACIADSKQVEGIGLNAWIQKLEIARTIEGQTEDGREFGIFVENSAGQRREYTLWFDKNYTLQLRIRENGQELVNQPVLLLSEGRLEKFGNFPNQSVTFQIQFFLEVNNQGLDVLYLKEGPRNLSPVDASALSPSQMIVIDPAVRFTLGDIARIGLIGYGGETQVVIWPLAIFGEGEFSITRPVSTATSTRPPDATVPSTAATAPATPTPPEVILGRGLINKAVVSVWKEPNKSKIATLFLDQPVILLELKFVSGSNWFRCRWEDNGTLVEGWILAEYISIIQ